MTENLYVQQLLAAVQDNWRELVKGTGHEDTPCPLNYSTADRYAHQVDMEKWGQSVELMARFLQDAGAYAGWDGWVSHADYQPMETKLQYAREQFLDRESRNAEEREQWLRVFPFQESQEGEVD